VIPIAQFLQALVQTGYDGPVRSEPLTKRSMNSTTMLLRRGDRRHAAAVERI